MKSPLKTPSAHLADHRLCVGPAGELPHTWGVDHAGTATLIRLGGMRISIDTGATPPDIAAMRRAGRNER